MRRLFSTLGILAIVAFLGLQQGHAAQLQSDVDGMDHSKLNHGVLGHIIRQVGDERPQASGVEVASIDPDVTGMDHSKLDHGVLGASVTSIAGAVDVAVSLASPASDVPPPSSWAPPAEIAAAVRAMEHRSAVTDDGVVWQPPAEIMRSKPDTLAQN